MFGRPDAPPVKGANAGVGRTEGDDRSSTASAVKVGRRAWAESVELGGRVKLREVHGAGKVPSSNDTGGQGPGRITVRPGLVLPSLSPPPRLHGTKGPMSS
jgi:hypothetical protein